MEQATIKKRRFTREIDMTKGKIFPKILMMSLPIMATGVLQLLFNAADIMVVGKFEGDVALGAVGSTTAFVNLLVNFFIGLANGGGVVMAKYFGAKDKERGDKLLHTALPLGVISGVLISIFGCFSTPFILRLMKTPEECLPLSITYLTIFFLGAPFNMVYNFGAAMLRATGDTVRPLIFLTIGGVLNVGVNLMLVAVFSLGVAGVAYATVLSQAVSAVLVVIALCKNKGFIKLSFKKIRMHGEQLWATLKIGLPSGLQAALFSVSNMIIQSTVNSFGEVHVAGNSAASSLEGFMYTIINSVSQACVTAVGQNYGAGDYKRIRKYMYQSTIFGICLGVGVGGAMYLGRVFLVSLYTNTQEAAQVSFNRLALMLPCYFLLATMDIINNGMRGMGYSIIPMANVLIGTCVLRVIWVYVIFPLKPLYITVLLSYPISWIITSTTAVVIFEILFRKRKKAYAKKLAESNISEINKDLCETSKHSPCHQ